MTIELRTGQSREYRREDYITKVCGAPRDPDCPTPLWTKFLKRITNDNTELQAYLQRVVGYCFTGSVREHVLFFLYGTGANGKGVFLNTTKGVLGDYAVTASMDTFIESDHERHPTELAFLHGARLVIAQETESGRRWAQSKIQALTGGDDITARYMRQDFFTFRPQFKLVIAGNHKPSLTSIDEAIRRRFHLIPFIVTIPKEERDPDLAEKLKPEWSGILEWGIQGCLKWQEIGLSPPAVVREATDRYLNEEDAFRRWIDDCCDVAAKEFGVGSELWGSWKKWSTTNGESTRTRKWFAQEMDKRGYRPDRRQEERGYIGITLRPPF